MTRDWKSGDGRPGWDAKDDIGSQSSGSLSLRRFVAVIVFASLMGIVGWILWSLLATPPITRIVAARVSGYSTLTVKPVPFLSADTDALLKLPDSLENATTIATKEIGPIDRAGSLTNPDFGVASSEPLLMYIKGHGVTIAGKGGQLQPVLLCGNSYHPGASDGVLLIEELLLKLGKVNNSATKLLVLDCNYLVSDLRLSLAVNEFAEHVGKIVAKSEDKDLWVILSGGDQQISITNHERGMSRFMTAMTDGLTYIGDTDENGKVSLAEFYNYLLVEVASRAVFSPGAKPMQTPILLHAGSSVPVPVKDLPTDVVVVASAKPPEPLKDWEKSDETEEEKSDNDEDLKDDDSKQARMRPHGSPFIIASMLFQQTPPVSAADAKANEPTVPPKQPATDKSKPGTTQQPPANGTADPALPPATDDPVVDPKPKTSNDGQPVKETVIQLLRDAAKYRQRLVEDPLKIIDGRVRWSPIAFAPHLVKRLDLRLHEAEYRSIFAGVNASSDLEGLVGDLEFISRGRSVSSVKPGDSPALQQAIERFAANPATTDLKDALTAARADKKVAKRLTDLVGYWNLYMSTAYHLPFFVQWHDDMSSISEGTHTSFANVSNLIAELKILRLRLESDLRSSGYDDIESTARSVKRLRDRIENNIREVCTSATSVAPQIEAAVRTPIPDQEERATARERLIQLSAVDPANGPFSPAALGGVSWQWDRAFDRMRLHAQMIGLVDCPGINKTEITAFDIKRPMSDSAAKKLMRDNARKLLDIYQRLVAAAFSDDEAVDRFLAMNFALPSLNEPSGEFITPPVQFPTFTPGNQLTVAWNQPAMDLKLSEQSTAVVVARMTKAQTDSIRINFTFSPPNPDAEIIYVSPTRGAIPLNQGEDYAQTIGPDGLSRFELRIKPKQFADTALGDSPTVSVTAKVAGWRPLPGDTLEATLTAQMPTRNIVDLRIKPISIFPTGVFSNKYTLRAYPNRPTTHRISLLNETGVDRSVRVVMYQVTRPRNANWPNGMLFADDTFTTRQPRLFPGLKETLEQITATGLVVATSYDGITLPAGSEKNVMFEALKVPDEKNKDARSIRDIDDGILVKIIDLKKQGEGFAPTSEAWYHWLELLPIPPSMIFDCDADWTAFDSTVTVAVNPKGDLPGEWKKPVLMGCRITPGNNENDSLENLDFQIGYQDLRIENLPAMETRTIYVDVDGYPRAFALKLPCPAVGDRKPLPLEKRYSVRFEQLRAADGSRSFTRIGQAADAFGLEVFVDGKPGDPIKRQFTKPFFHGRNVKTLESRLAVDVPGGFTDRRASNTVQVRINETVTRTFSRDRDVRYSVSAVGDGSFTVASQIRDHVFQFPQSLRNGGEMNISATIDDQGQVAGEDQVSVIIDESPPEIELQIKGRSTIYEGDSCTVEIVYRGKDTPLRMLEFGIDEDGNERLSKPEIVETYKDWPVQFNHSFKGLKPGDYTLIARVTDGVDQISDDAQGTRSTALLTVRPNPKKKKK